MTRKGIVLQLQATADDTRLQILQLASRGDPTATEVNSRLGMSQPRVAHHLKILVSAGLLNSRRDGRFMRYTLPTTGFEAMLVRLILDGLKEAHLSAPGNARNAERNSTVRARETTPEVAKRAPDPEPQTEESPEPPANQIEDFLL